MSTIGPAPWLNCPSCGSGETGDCVCPMVLDEAKAFLERMGYVVLKAKSYRSAQERQRIAQIRMEDAFDRVEHIDEWAQGLARESNRLRERVTFVYGVARAHGATVEELSSQPSDGGAA